MQASAARTIAKGRVREWLTQLMEQAEVIAPTGGHMGDVMFLPISSPEQVVWQFENTLHPPKQFVLPQTEPIVAIHRNGGGYEVEPIYDERRRILFNIRNCDVKGIAFLDRMHTFELTDSCYARRRENMTLISLSCSVPCPLCFCICMDAGPFLKDSYDIQLTDLGERLLAEPGSEKGQALLDGAGNLFRPASNGEMKQRLRLEETARKHFGEETCHFASAMRPISTGRVEEGLWSKMSDWCLECGGCNLICPTCYCFSVKDRKQDGMLMRCRTWDSCQYAAFTLEASGHNPRPERKDRMKRRFFHKVSAQYYQRDGAVGCVGCGRCVEVCLGTTDMPAVVAGIRKGAWNG